MVQSISLPVEFSQQLFFEHFQIFSVFPNLLLASNSTLNIKYIVFVLSAVEYTSKKDEKDDYILFNVSHDGPTFLKKRLLVVTLVSCWWGVSHCSPVSLPGADRCATPLKSSATGAPPSRFNEAPELPFSARRRCIDGAVICIAGPRAPTLRRWPLPLSEDEPALPAALPPTAYFCRMHDWSGFPRLPALPSLSPVQ